MRLGSYEVISQLGKGAFGTTYLVERNGWRYALKWLHSSMDVMSERAIQRMEREISILKTIRHPHIVQYVDDGIVIFHGKRYRIIIMEFIEGDSLRKLMSHRHFSVSDACVLGTQLFQGILGFHAQRIVHRDLKPSNLMVTKQGNELKIIDFGHSKWASSRLITDTGAFIGTYPYMAPEQAASSKHVDERADYYSAGVILYELLSGEKPISIQNSGEIEKIWTIDHVPLTEKVPNIPKPLSDIVDLLLMKNPEERNPHMQGILNTMRACIQKG